MPDTVALLLPPASSPPPPPPSLSPAAGRRPALAGFLARRLLATAWGPDGPPRVGSRRWLVETCRAELAWSVADWRRVTGRFGICVDERGEGPHPSEAWRLPHEVAAARFVSCHSHVDVEEWRLGELGRAIRAQRRAGWVDAAERTLADYRLHLARRRKGWRALLAAADRYRALRAAVDAPGGPPALREAA